MRNKNKNQITEDVEMDKNDYQIVDPSLVTFGNRSNAVRPLMNKVATKCQRVHKGSRL